MSDFTKKRESEGRFGPIWRLYVDGKPTPFRVTKSVSPRYREPQQYDVFAGTDEDLGLLFSAKSCEHAVSTVRLIYDAAHNA